MKSGNSCRLPLGAGGALLLATLLPLQAEIIAAWETTGQTSFGTDGLAPSIHAPGVTVGGLTRGAGVSISGGTSVADAWGGKGLNAETIEDAVAAGNFITFTVTPASGAAFSANTFDLHYRRSTSGPLYAALQFQIGGGGFIDVEELQLESDATSGGTISDIDLTGYGELQGVSGQTVTFRLVPFGTTDSGDQFFVYGPPAGYDLVLNGEVTGGGGGDTSPPLVNGLTPVDNATGLTAATTTLLTMTFNESVARGTGQILVKESLSDQTVYSLDVTDPAKVTLTANQIGLVLASALAPGTEYHVEVPAGAIRDLAAPANPYAGLAGSSAWNFTTAVVALPPRVVVNKYLNGSPDRVELLVIGSGAPGATVDLRGMILKDFSGDMSGDGGGKLLFAANPLWAAVPAGTLVTLSNSVTSTDLAGADYQLAVGLGDPACFTPVPGSPAMDLTATDMVLIKEPGSDPAGTSGGIHALAAGVASPTSYFSLYPGAKLRATATTGTNLGVRAGNSTGSQADYMSGTDATGNLPLALSDFGAPNNGPNATYITSLRGWTPGDGDGVATLVNATLSSPLLGLPMFDDGQVNQSARLTIVPRSAGVTLSTLRIEVPPVLGAPGGVALAGPGAAGAAVSITGQMIHITSAAATPSNPLEVTIGGLSTPLPVLVSDNGNYPLAISTSASGGSLTPIASQAALRVIIPIASLRDVDSEGAPLDAGTVVAVEGTVTEADFGGGAGNFSGFIQDRGAGINITSPTTFLGLVRGNRFAVAGTVTQTNGLTGLIPSSGANVVNRGPVTESKAQVLTLATLQANPEAHEGKLVTVKNLSYDSGTWAAGGTIILRDSTLSPLEIRILSGSTATSPPPYPATITGIFSQADASLPFTSAYQLLPRDELDLRAWVDDFAAWATDTGALGGPTGDQDFDGKDNTFEYAFGLDPASGNTPQPIVAALDPLTGKFRYTRRALSLTDFTYRVFTSPDLSDWTEDQDPTEFVTATVANVETVEVTLSGSKPLAAARLFIRLEVE